jgi:arsenate reductase
MPSILFVCVHNACRSQIAEANCRNLAPPGWTIASAGTNPSARVDGKAVELLRRHQLAMPSTQPKGFVAVPAIQWDCVVDITDGDYHYRVSARERIKWDIPDPLDGSMALYEALFQEISDRVRKLIPEIPA